MTDIDLLDRESSWLEFNKRVLTLSKDSSVPFKDRLFLFGITHSNLDEFFQIRISGLLEKVYETINQKLDVSISKETFVYFIDILEEAKKEMINRNTVWKEYFVKDLEKHGVNFKRMKDLTESELDILEDYFDNNIKPLLTPLAADPTHPFPYISDLSLSIGVVIKNEFEDNQFIRIKIPASLGSFVNLNKEQLVWIHELVLHYIDKLFFPHTVIEKFWFRTTRDADLEFRASLKRNFLEVVKEGLENRKLGKIVRLEIQEGVSVTTQKYLKNNLEIDYDLQVELKDPLTRFQINSLIDHIEFSTSWKLHETEFEFSNDMFEIIKNNDVMVHHPYDSFEKTVLRFLEKACFDPYVRAIKMTQYRTGLTAENDKITSLLASAARGGKQVAVLVELRARFDEEQNISNAEYLEESGVHVTYGDPRYKAHTKMILVVREENNELVPYMHFGTGNYNVLTSKGYEDIGIFTSDKSIGNDCGIVFNSLTAYADRENLDELLVAPESLEKNINSLIEEQIDLGEEGKIVLKLNNLTDPLIIQKLYDAAKAGNQINIIVRGICCLIPIKNINVISILGPFLEHSRIYKFGRSDIEKIYIGSADLMQRNLRHRIEVLVPIKSPIIKKKLSSLLEKYIKSDKYSWTLKNDGTWKKLDGNYNIQEKLNK